MCTVGHRYATDGSLASVRLVYSLSSPPSPLPSPSYNKKGRREGGRSPARALYLPTRARFACTKIRLVHANCRLTTRFLCTVFINIYTPVTCTHTNNKASFTKFQFIYIMHTLADEFSYYNTYIQLRIFTSFLQYIQHDYKRTTMFAVSCSCQLFTRIYIIYTNYLQYVHIRSNVPFN